MESWHQCYIDFIRYSLDETLSLPKSSDNIDWDEFFVLVQRQAITGIIFSGIKRASSSVKIPSDILFQFIGYSNKIELRNKELNRICVELSESLKKEGIDSCILKGQGNAVMYPAPLLRTAGDIDVWVKGKSVKDIIKIVRNHNPRGRATYHHVHWGDYRGVDVEVHYRPTFMNNLIVNKRLQRWILAHKDEQFSNYVMIPEVEKSIAVPTWEFNVVLQLKHIYGHVVQSGIGLKQIIDYYYLLKSREDNNNCDFKETLDYLKLKRIAGAVMWVLRDVLGLDEKYLIVPVDVKRGSFLYSEIMRGGYFGIYDKTKNHKGSFGRNIGRLKQDIRLIRYFTSECLWEPVFRFYHFIWRLQYK